MMHSSTNKRSAVDRHTRTALVLLNRSGKHDSSGFKTKRSAMNPKRKKEVIHKLRTRGFYC